VSARVATAPAVARGNDLSFRPGQPAYRGQFWASVSAAARRRGPDASLPGPGAVPHPPLVRVSCPSRCPRPGPGGMWYMARHQTIARLPTPGPPGRGHDAGAAVTCAFTAMARIWRGCPRHPRSCRHSLAGLALAGLPVPCGQPL